MGLVISVGNFLGALAEFLADIRGQEEVLYGIEFFCHFQRLRFPRSYSDWSFHALSSDWKGVDTWLIFARLVCLLLCHKL